MPNLLKKVLLPFVLLLTPFAFAQRPTGNAPQVGEVSTDTLNIGLNVPLVSKKGVGLPFSVGLSFNNNFWFYNQTSDGPVAGFWAYTSRGYTSVLGWMSVDNSIGSLATIQTKGSCVSGGGNDPLYILATQTQRAHCTQYLRYI